MENNDIFDLSCSKKEMDFLKRGLKVDYDIIIDIIEVFSGFPFVSSLVKLGMLGNKYFELQFIRKVSRFLQKDVEIPIVKKKQFLNNLKPRERQRLHNYIMHFLLHAEDEEKADLMGYCYEECLRGKIDTSNFLRMCFVINNAFLDDLRELPNYVKVIEECSIASNNFINLGLIDNYVGGVWKNSQSYQLNEFGLKFYEILKAHDWFDE